MENYQMIYGTDIHPLRGHKKSHAKTIMHWESGRDPRTGLRMWDSITDICLRSCGNFIIRYDTKTRELYCRRTFSRTTIKHIGWFLEEFFPCDFQGYEEFKKLLEMNAKQRHPKNNGTWIYVKYIPTAYERQQKKVEKTA